MKNSRLLAFARPGLLAVMMSFVPTGLALADDDAPFDAADPERARVLFKQGRRLATAGRYHEACAKFEESQRFDDGLGIQFNLADCFEHIGRTASAHSLFAHVTEAAARSGQDDRSELARQRAGVLEPRLARVVIKSEGPVANLELLRDGRPIGSAIDQPFAVDPGPHNIEVRWPDNRRWSVRLEVPPTAGTVAVMVPKLGDLAEIPVVAPAGVPVPARTLPRVAWSNAPPPTVPRVDLVAGPPTVPETTPPETTPRLRTAAFVSGTVGVAALAASGWMALRYRESNQNAKEICPTSINCTAAQIQAHERLVDDARSALRWTYVGLGAGGAALIGATALYLRGRPDRTSAETDVAAAPVLTPGAFGFLLRGSW